MSDITEIFRKVAPDASDPTSDQLDADLARGHRAVRRADRQRRIKRSMITATSVAAVAVLVVVGAQLHGNGSNSSAKHPTTTAKKPSVVKVSTTPKSHHPATVKTHHKATAIKLVAYHGTQLHGFTVDSIPQGWFLSTSTQYALLIDPAGSKDNDPDAFEGKLAVLLASQDEATFPKHGDHVTVNGRPGIIWDDGGVQLEYPDAAGHRIIVQPPASLHWSNAQLINFAEGVHVTGDAIAGVG
jgi:hypothetical protein